MDDVFVSFSSLVHAVGDSKIVFLDDRIERWGTFEDTVWFLGHFADPTKHNVVTSVEPAPVSEELHVEVYL